MASPPFRIVSRLVERVRRRRRPDVQIALGYQDWIAREGSGPAVLHGPVISVIMPVYETPEAVLRAAIGSVTKQSFPCWELCIADDGSASPHVAEVLAEQARLDGRIRLVQLPGNAGIAAATNAALALAAGAFVALLDHDDELAPGALARVAAELAAYPDADIVFSDEDQLVDGIRRQPYFKPGWNPDLMLSQNLISHLGVYRRSLVERIGGMRAGFDGSQDYDFALRAAFATDSSRIRHVPEILYHWRQHQQSFSAQRLSACQAAARKALAECMAGTAEVTVNAELPQWSRIVYPVPEPLKLVSIIVPEGGEAPADPAYRVVEILHDATSAQGAVLVFLAAGLVSSSGAWLHELVGQALRPDIGCVGGRLDRPDGRIFQAGYTLHPERVAQSLRPGSDHHDPGYFGHFLLARSISAVSLDCLAVRRDVFIQAGGWNAEAGAYADVDLCLRVAETGLRCVWTPHARLRYRTLPGEKPDPDGARFMRSRWGQMLVNDPYSNPNLMIRNNNLALAENTSRPAEKAL